MSCVDTHAVQKATRALLLAIGEDPDRPGLKETPRRVADFWKEFIDYNSGNTDVLFESTSTDQLVVVSGIRVWSLCEHHLLPFWCTFSIGYLTGDQVLGLSKFARVAHQVAHSCQIQERMTQQVADRVVELTGAPDVAVLGQGVHMCMVMRGIKTAGVMKTSVLRGDFQQDPDLRRDFLALSQTARPPASPLW